MDVTVIGAGYVGMVQAVGLTAFGHRVRVGEADPAKVRMISEGRSPIYEAGLEERLADAVRSGLLTVHGDNLEALEDAEVVFIALPTPAASDGSTDMSAIEGLLDDLDDRLAPGTVLVFKSTVPVGTVAATQERFGSHVHVASNPEFLREGSAIADFLAPDRVVIGSTSVEAATKLQALYASLDCPVVVTDPVSAELAKYAANAYLATRVTFGNAIANLCEAVGANVDDVLDGMGYDRRIGRHFMKPGPGYGGSCFPKDTLALVHVAERAGYDFTVLKSVIAENETQRRRVLDKVRAAAGGDLAGARVAVWGAAYKAGTDDLRSSPALWLIEHLAAEGAELAVYDPAATVPGVEMAPTALAAVADADVLLVATEWDEFSSIAPEAIAGAMRGSWVVDARNMLDPAAVGAAGLSYRGVGR